MSLDDLLDADEGEVSEWLRGEDLLHECDCGYTVYDPEAVNSAVQETWGDERCDEIFAWACSLADIYGWLFIESARPEFGIYHCQHCEGSEWSFLMDMEKIASISGDTSDSGAPSRSAVATPMPTERLVVYIDESYSDEFPRKPDGSLAYAALIIPESQVDRIEGGIVQVLSESYRGRPANELKYNRISKRPALLERVGARVVKLLADVPGARLLAVFVPQAGYFGEKKRSIAAVSHYAGTPPSDVEMRRVDSTPAIEAAVRDVPNQVAHLVASCVASFVGSNASFAKIVFDPRSKQLDNALAEELQKFLPSIPVDVPLIRHGDAIVTPWPSAESQRLGDRVKCEFVRSSHDCRGLQLADFLAGDVRTFFNEVDDLLDASTTVEPLVNRRVLFPEAFHVGRISTDILDKLHKRTGKSFLPDYRERLVNRLISYYTRNGQMRNLDTQTGEVFDLMD